MTTTADFPHGCVLIDLEDGTRAGVPHDDALAPLARRWLHGNRKPGDEEKIRAWLGKHPQCELTCVPAAATPTPPVPLRTGQLTLWEDAA